MKFIVAQPIGNGDFIVMENQRVGDVEVYAEYARAQTAKRAEAIADSLNDADRRQRGVVEDHGMIEVVIPSATPPSTET